MPCLQFRLKIDERGSLLPLEFADLSFVPRRIFCVSGVPADTVRGGHGPSQGNQLLVVISGRIEVIVQRLSGAREYFAFDAKGQGCQLAAGDVAWQRYRSYKAQLLVIADEPYDPKNYVYVDAIPSESEWEDNFK